MSIKSWNINEKMMCQNDAPFCIKNGADGITHGIVKSGEILRRGKKFTLYHKNVIVTGASGGLGRELTLCLIRDYHCRVLGIGRNEQRLRETAELLGDAADRFRYRVADVTRREDWQALTAEAAADGFDAEVLVNNAGMLPRFSRFGDYTEEEIAVGIETNLRSVLYGCRAFLPLWEKKQGTAIINIASADALCPLVGTSVYSAGKAAVKALSEAMREEYRGRVYIPVVCPGFIRTDIMKGQRRAVSPLVNAASMPADKAARVILRRVNARRPRIVLGADAHFMSCAFRIAPVWSLRMFRAMMKAWRLALFADIFE